MPKTAAKDKKTELTTSKILKLAKDEKITKIKKNIKSQQSKDPAQPVIHENDCLKWLDLQDSCDLLLTEPPYMTDIDGSIFSFAKEWLAIALDKVRPTGRAYIFIGAYPDEIEAYLTANRATQWRVQNILVWTYRNTLGPSPKYDYKLNCQAILNLKGSDAPPLDCPLMNEQFSVQDINAPDGRLSNKFHTWQKPDEIAERFIRHSNKKGDLILDPFAGTGTFLLAASRLDRVSIGCEKNKEMLKIAETRGCKVKWLAGTIKKKLNSV